MKTKALISIGLLFLSLSAAQAFTQSGKIYKTDGSQSDVQSACNAAPDDGTITVEIPEGTYAWTGTLKVHKALTLSGTSPGSWSNPTPASAFKTVIENKSGSNMLDACSSLKGHLIIANIRFLQLANNPPGSAYCLALDRSDWDGTKMVATPYTCLVHDCFLDAGKVGSYIAWIKANGIIFWHTTLIGNSGFQCVSGKYSEGQGGGWNVQNSWVGGWNTPDTYGTQDTTGVGNTYFEDCYIGVGDSGASQYTVNADDNSRIVFRNSTFQDSALGSHGQESSPFGSRLWEFYHNVFHCSANNPQNMQNYFTDRGGAGVMWGNTVDMIPWGKPFIQFLVLSADSSQQIPQQTSYPAARQCGQGWSASSSKPYGNPVIPADGTGQVTAGIYLWDNKGWSDTDPAFVAGNKYMQKDRDYFFSAKPGYTPYPYPHPLHAQYGSGGGAPPQPTPTAQPTATPGASATPTPDASPTWEKWIKQQNDWIRANPPTAD